MRRPRHLTERNARVFEDPEVVSCYHHRPPYPERLIDLLANLVDPSSSRVLELGCGLGEVARRLASRVQEVVAADPSRAMIEAARTLPGADRVRWIRSRTEDLEAEPGLGLIVTAESLHWMDWDKTFALARAALSRQGRFAIITSRKVYQVPWGDALRELAHLHSTLQGFEAYDLIGTLVDGGLLELEEQRRAGPAPFRQSVADYLASWHSRSSLSRARMGADSADRFDRAVAALVEPHAREGMLEYEVVATVAWGRVSRVDSDRRAVRSPGRTPSP